GFGPNACKLLVKVGYDPKEEGTLGKVPTKITGEETHGMTSTQKMLKDKRYAVNNLSMRLGYRPPSPVRIAIKRANTYHITIKEEIVLKGSRRSFFDRLGKVTPSVSVFERLGP
ncbi:hypothetical protein ACH5RR_003203, partial [Cinchona calisaya]